MLAGDVDEGLPFGVGEVYACLAICCCYQVSYDPIVLTAPYIRLAPYARRAISISAFQHFSCVGSCLRSFCSLR